MKRVLKSIARAGWGLTGPIRRPLGRKLDAALTRVLTAVLREELRQQLTQAIMPRFDGMEAGLNLSRHEVHVQGVDANLTLDSLVREVARLQMQIEVLQQIALEKQEPADGLSVVAGPDEGDEFAAESG